MNICCKILQQEKEKSRDVIHKYVSSYLFYFKIESVSSDFDQFTPQKVNYSFFPANIRIASA